MSNTKLDKLELALLELGQREPLPKGDRELGSRARALAQARHTRRRQVASVCGLLFLVGGWIVVSRRPTGDEEQGAQARSQMDLRSDPGSDPPADARLELTNLRLEQAHLLIGWEEYRHRNEALNLARLQVGLDYVANVERTQRAAFELLELARIEPPQDPETEKRLRTVIRLFPETRAAQEASRLLAARH